MIHMGILSNPSPLQQIATVSRTLFFHLPSSCRVAREMTARNKTGALAHKIKPMFLKRALTYIIQNQPVALKVVDLPFVLINDFSRDGSASFTSTISINPLFPMGDRSEISLRAIKDSSLRSLPDVYCGHSWGCCLKRPTSNFRHGQKATTQEVGSVLQAVQVYQAWIVVFDPVGDV